MKFFTRFNPNKVEGLRNEAPTMTQLQFQADTDINRMVQRALAGDMSVLVHGGHFDVDFSDAPESFHDALNKASFANTVWQSLPDQVRASYGSPERFVEAYSAFIAAKSMVKPSEKASEVTPKGAEDTTPKSTPANT